MIIFIIWLFVFLGLYHLLGFAGLSATAIALPALGFGFSWAFVLSMGLSLFLVGTVSGSR